MLRRLLIFPFAMRWISRTIAGHRASSRAVAACGFPRLPRLFDAELLACTRLAVVDEVPQPPLERWGLGDAEAMMPSYAAGITLRDTIFVRQGLARDESLIFHELVHAAQWRALGANRFVALYGLLMLQHGYRDNPLEEIAYRLQREFDRDAPIEDLSAAVARHARAEYASLRATSIAHRLVLSLIR